MSNLRPPSASPSPSPTPNENGRANRQSMGPGARGTPMAPPSPRPGGGSGARPTSELLGSAGMFQTPEAEALDQWFENLQNYEATLEEMAAASLDVNFKEELSAIEQWFKVLSEAERTAALYSLLQHSNQVQIRFFITVLQQMARSDPMTALLSPAMGGSMQSQMEAKLATLKSPGLKSGLPASPTTRNFAANRQSLALDNSSNFLSPDSAAANAAALHQENAAATLAQQRAKLKASNAAHRISAPVLASPGPDGRASWGAVASQLSQVAETGPTQEVVVSASSRPKSTEFSGSMNSPRPGEPVVGGESWASMVNTPLLPMFQNTKTQNIDAAATKLNEWVGKPAAGPEVPRMGDPTIHRRKPPSNDGRGDNQHGGAVYDDNGNLVGPGGGPQNRGGNRNVSGGNGGWGPAGTRSPPMPNVPSNRFGSSDDGHGPMNGGGGPMSGLGMQMGAPQFNLNNLGAAGIGLGMPGMGPMSPFNMNMLMTPEAQLLAAQIAASGFGQPNWLGMQAQVQAGMAGNNPNNRRNQRPSGGGGGGGGGNMKGGHGGGGGGGALTAPKSEDDVDPQLLNDIPAWLRSLRLHKYTPNFEGMKWQDMVMMDEAQLEAKGVAALGARRKMLKTFEVVRKKLGIEGPPA
ncbi:hypothetical protein BDN72DRAFT_803553 [Pluteus cervinus]|uniref:Uncharacterized protein n=1 Tax=Pluteus cervinus TaxID=181527 RepID=A0ACD3AE70_9AGAR|nr:hypothetical protein BDN72DRAFT_803553 [Pluteus cervinus]